MAREAQRIGILLEDFLKLSAAQAGVDESAVRVRTERAYRLADAWARDPKRFGEPEDMDSDSEGDSEDGGKGSEYDFGDIFDQKK